MDNYIIRIYRCTGEPVELVGQVERVGTMMKETFHCSDDLLKILTSGRERTLGGSEEGIEKSEPINEMPVSLDSGFTVGIRVFLPLQEDLS